MTANRAQQISSNTLADWAPLFNEIGVSTSLLTTTFPAGSEPDFAQLYKYCTLWRNTSVISDPIPLQHAWQLLCLADEDLACAFLESTDAAHLEAALDSKKNSPAHYIAFRGNVRPLQLLLKKLPAAYKAKNFIDSTALHCATFAGAKDTATYLLTHFPALTEMTDHVGQIFFAHAPISGSADFIKSLCANHALLTARSWAKIGSQELDWRASVTQMPIEPSTIRRLLLEYTTTKLLAGDHLNENEFELLDAFYPQCLEYLTTLDTPEAKQSLAILSQCEWPILTLFIANHPVFAGQSTEFLARLKMTTIPMQALLELLKVSPTDDTIIKQAKCDLMLLILCFSDWNEHGKTKLMPRSRLKELMQQWEQQIADRNGSDVSAYVCRRLQLATMESPRFLAGIATYTPIKRFMADVFRSHAISVEPSPEENFLAAAAAAASSTMSSLFTATSSLFSSTKVITTETVIKEAISQLQKNNIAAAKQEFEKLFGMNPINAVHDLSESMPTIEPMSRTMYYVLLYQAAILAQQEGHLQEAYSYFSLIDQFPAEQQDKSTYMRLLQMSAALNMANTLSDADDKQKCWDELADHFGRILILAPGQEKAVYDKLNADIHSNTNLLTYFNSRHQASLQVFQAATVQTAATATSVATAAQRAAQREGLFGHFALAIEGTFKYNGAVGDSAEKMQNGL